MNPLRGRTRHSAGSAHSEGPAHGFRAWESGASLVEYVLLVALIAVAVIAAISFFGGEVDARFEHVGRTVSSTP
ncbi:MAG: Flp family type IVb pilin [Acidimicrobiia bacterium]